MPLFSTQYCVVCDEELDEDAKITGYALCFSCMAPEARPLTSIDALMESSTKDDPTTEN